MVALASPVAPAPDAEAEKRAHVERIIADFRHRPGSLIQILHAVQGIYGFLPFEIQQRVAEALDQPLSQVSGVSSFYSFFTTRPRGEHVLRVCLGTACYVRGGQKICKRLCQTLGVEVGETTPDRKFTLEVMRCMGACSLAPAVMLDDTVLRQVHPDRLARTLAGIR
jgi:NADH:ubiquinone oxidoreductase subunit E